MAQAYRNCLVCGKRFKVCNTCLKSVPEDLQWRRVVCCPQHLAYHMPIIGYSRKIITKDKAKKELENAIKTFGEVEFVEDIKPIVHEILS